MEILEGLIESGFLGIFCALVPCFVMVSIFNGTERAIKVKK